MPHINAEQIDRILGSNTSEIIGVLSQLMSTTGALDALFQNIAARSDPTIPVLLNTQLQRLAELQNTGGFDAGGFLGGDFSRADPANQITFGEGGGPFDIPIQEAGGVNPLIMELMGIIGPQTFDSLQGIVDVLAELGGPSFFPGTLHEDEGVSQPAGQQTGQQTDQDSGVADILAQLGLGGPGGAAGGTAPQVQPVLGSFQQGGTVPQTGLFQLEQGEQVIPNPGQAQTTPPVFSPTAPAPNPLPTQDDPPPSIPFDLGGNPAPLPVPVDQGQQDQAGAGNPLQQAIQALLQMVQGGGPLQQNISDAFSQQLLSSRRNVAEDFGRRGLGGSGIQEQLGLQAELGALNTAQRASNAQALQSAQALGQLSLGAGGFGLAQNQQQFQQNQSLFESIMRALQSFTSPGENPVQTVNVI